MNDKLSKWLPLFSTRPVPIFRSTHTILMALDIDDEKTSIQQISNILLHDPFLTFHLIRFLQEQQFIQKEITSIPQALLLIGLKRFYSIIPQSLFIEDLLQNKPKAIQVIHSIQERTQIASHFVMLWSAQKHDLHFDEMQLTTLLHDFTELLLWVFIPDVMARIHQQQTDDPNLRSPIAQRRNLGFTIPELQLELIRIWKMPDLLQKILDESHYEKPNVQRILYAFSLARHLQTLGLENPALPDDYRMIAHMLNLQPESVERYIHQFWKENTELKKT